MLSYFMSCIDLVRCVLELRCGMWWCGVLMQVEALVCFNLHKDTTPPQTYHNVTPTHIEPGQYNPRNNSARKSQAPDGWMY